MCDMVVGGGGYGVVWHCMHTTDYIQLLDEDVH